MKTKYFLIVERVLVKQSYSTNVGIQKRYVSMYRDDSKQFQGVGCDISFEDIYI